MQADEVNTVGVLCVDDHPVVGVGIKLALRQYPRYHFIGIVGSGEYAVPEILKHRPGVLVLDLAFGGRVQLSMVSECRNAMPQGAIIIFSSLPARVYKQEALAAGADAFVSKETDIEELVKVVGEVLERPRDSERATLSESAAFPALDLTALDLGRGIHLTPRERDVARLLSRGVSIAQIAASMGISVKTAAAHRDNLRKKFECSESSELIARLARLVDDKAGE